MPLPPFQDRESVPRRLAPWFTALWLLTAAGSVQARMTIDLEWTATTGNGVVGSDLIEALPGDELTLDIIATVDAAGVDSYSVSVAFDLNGLDELDLIETIELEHVATTPCDPLIEQQLGAFPLCFTNFGNQLVNASVGVESEIESTPGNEGLAGGFEAQAEGFGPGAGVVSLSFRVGRIRFLVTENVASNGDDLEGSLILDTTKFSDAYVDDSLTLFVFPGDLPSPDFVPGFAAVDVPEPGPGLLAAVALGVIAGLRRSRRDHPPRSR